MADEPEEPSIFRQKTDWLRALVEAKARPGDMLIAGAIAGCMLKTTDCYPGQDFIRSITGVSRQTISAVIARLERAGALTVDRSPRKGRRQDSSTYALVAGFDLQAASAVFLEGRPGRKSSASARADADPQGKHAPPSVSALEPVSVNTRRAQRRRVPTVREEKRSSREEKGEEKKPPLPFSPSRTKKKQPPLETVGLEKWTGHAALAKFPRCPHGHGARALMNHDDESWFVVCKQRCGWKADPRQAARVGVESDTEASEREAAKRARPRTEKRPGVNPGVSFVQPRVGVEPVGVIASQLLARSESA